MSFWRETILLPIMFNNIFSNVLQSQEHSVFLRSNLMKLFLEYMVLLLKIWNFSWWACPNDLIG